MFKNKVYCPIFASNGYIRYWVIFFYCLPHPILILLRHLNAKVHGHFNSYSRGRQGLYTYIFVEKSIQCFTVYRYWVLVSVKRSNTGYCVLLGTVLT